MVQNVITATSPADWPWFSAAKKVEATFFQDHIHVGTKLKSRLLKPSVILPLGEEYVVSKGHIVELIKTTSKDQHELSNIHVNPKDKMNYRALQKITDQKVTTLLRSKIASSEGTATYLDMTREVLEAFMKPDLTPLQRIKMIWKWTFFLRIWRKWIEESDDYTLGNNFITSNSYSCIEVNAHCLIQIIILLRDAEEPSLFLPWKLSSQDCEKIYRTLRSALAAHCGVTAFSILDLESHFRRLDLLSSTYVNLAKVLTFPRHHKAAILTEETAHIPSSLPEDYEINFTVSEALSEAMALAKFFKMLPKNWRETAVSKCHLKVKAQLPEYDIEDEDNELIIMDPDADEGCEPEVEIDDSSQEIVEDLFMISTGALGVKKYHEVPLTESSPFVLVCDGFMNPAIIRKSTLCWLLSSNDTKLSSDRLARVMAAPVQHSLFLTEANQSKHPSVEETINVGDWCAFTENRSIAIGRVLAFSYLSGTSLKNQEFSQLSAPVKAPDKNARGLGCLCSWFYLKGNGKVLYQTKMDVQGYYSVASYICTLPRPTYQDGRLTLPCNVKDILKLKD